MNAALGPAHLALSHARHNPGRSAVLLACFALVIALPLVSRGLVRSFDRALRERALEVPLLIGAEGSRFDLVFAALHFQRTDTRPIPARVYHDLRRQPGVVAIPIHARFSAQGHPVVGTSVEYLERRGLYPLSGRPFALLGEALLGHDAARRLGLGPGDTLPSDQARSYDITAPPALAMTVSGVLAPTGSPDDRAVFVDLQTAWVLEGIAHGHEPAQRVDDPNKLIGRSQDHVALSGAVLEYQRITPDNIDSFHVHGDPDDLPITAVIALPATDKARTLTAARVNADPTLQAVVPARVIDDLIAFVVRLRDLLDAVALAMGLATALLVWLIALLSYRVRAAEVDTLLEIGASRRVVAAVFGLEIAAILLAAALLALLAGLAADSLGGTLLLKLAA